MPDYLAGIAQVGKDAKFSQIVPVLVVALVVCTMTIDVKADDTSNDIDLSTPVATVMTYINATTMEAASAPWYSGKSPVLYWELPLQKKDCRVESVDSLAGDIQEGVRIDRWVVLSTVDRLVIISCIEPQPDGSEKRRKTEYILHEYKAGWKIMMHAAYDAPS